MIGYAVALRTSTAFDVRANVERLPSWARHFRIGSPMFLIAVRIIRGWADDRHADRSGPPGPDLRAGLHDVCGSHSDLHRPRGVRRTLRRTTFRTTSSRPCKLRRETSHFTSRIGGRGRTSTFNPLNPFPTRHPDRPGEPVNPSNPGRADGHAGRHTRRLALACEQDRALGARSARHGVPHRGNPTRRT